MPEITLRHPRNAAGRYYVDRSCVRCKLCHEIAPRHFTKTEEHDGFVCRQPANEIEEHLCQMARESCPVNAIGDHGDEAAASREMPPSD